MSVVFGGVVSCEQHELEALLERRGYLERLIAQKQRRRADEERCAREARAVSQSHSTGAVSQSQSPRLRVRAKLELAPLLRTDGEGVFDVRGDGSGAGVLLELPPVRTATASPFVHRLPAAPSRAQRETAQETPRPHATSRDISAPRTLL